MDSQKHLFQLLPDVHYLNCAYMSPLLITVEEAGIRGMRNKRNPQNVKSQDYFNEAEELGQKFGKLVNCNAAQVAVISSASYGLKTAINNLPTDNGKFAITVGDEFPSGYYSINAWCRDNNKELVVIKAPESIIERGKKWNEQLLETINSDTAVVVMSSIHWMDGTIFNLKEIGKCCKEVGARFIVDGTQSVGALPIDVRECNIDALICAGYKWLMGPYSIGLAYYSDFFNNGKPLEETWMNRMNATDFSKITNYTDEYKPGAGRYNVGEYGNFILVPMLNAALTQIAEWKPTQVQHYCGNLIMPLMHFLQANNYRIEEESYRAKHLFGFQVPPSIQVNQLMEVFQKRKISVSVRGNAIRISTHLFNTENDIAVLMDALSSLCR